MKILTWNVERLNKNNNQLILEIINSYDADIIVLTETSSKLDLSKNYNCISTEKLIPNYDGIKYEENENRTTIWTKYEIIKKHTTFDSYTSLRTEVKTEFGILNIYATIIGVFGGKGERFKIDLKKHLEDFKAFDINEFNCIIGDLNTSFSGYVYPSYGAKNVLNQVFDDLRMKNLTAEIDNNVDHIILSEKFIKDKKTEIEIWNLDKKLSDHIGICVNIK